MAFRCAWLSLAVPLLALTACGGPNNQIPSASEASAAGSTTAGQLRTSRGSHLTAPLWGTGIKGNLYLNEGSGSWSPSFCQTPGDTYVNCPYYRPGKKTERYSNSNGVSGYLGSASLALADVSKLGAQSYSHSNAIDSITDYYEGVESVTNSVMFWQDQLTPTSTSLPYGSPVKFKVKLQLKPSAASGVCQANHVSSDLLQFYAPGTDKLGYDLVTVFGSCQGATSSSPGTWEYTIGSEDYGAPGTEDTGTLTGYIDEPMAISGGAYVTSGLYNCASRCIVSASSDLSGSAKYTIKPMTSGVSFTTSSGYLY